MIDRIVPDEVKAAGGEGYVLIGEEISDRIALLPAQWAIYRTIRETYLKKPTVGLPQSWDEQQVTQGELGKFLTAPLPLGVWPNVMADPSAIADVIISKYDALQPLNRQENISERLGFRIPKSTQCGWIRTANAYCAPIVDAMFGDSIQNAFLLATDATGASVLPPRRSKEEASSEATVNEVRRCESWSVFVFIADRDHIVFKYNRKNNGAVLSEMLSGYHGHLLADAASVYDLLYREHGMTESGCWFHCRRPFYRALESDRERALEALSLISELFAINRELRLLDLDLKTFTRLRRERAAPILKLFDDWVDAQRDKVDERSPLASAIGYYDNQRDALRRFLDDGRIRLDNNWSEQALRKLVVGQSNWVFFANETGVAWYTTFRSLSASCMLHDLNPQIYLEQLLRIVPHWPKHRVLELAPKYWLDTVAKLDQKWRSILARPWEPDVVLSAKQETRSHRQALSDTVDSAA